MILARYCAIVIVLIKGTPPIFQDICPKKLCVSAFTITTMMCWQNAPKVFRGEDV